MTVKQQKSRLIKEMVAETLLVLLFLSITFHRPLSDFLIKFNQNQWYEGMAVIIDSHVKDIVSEGKTITHKYYVYAHYKYDSMGTTYESNSISNLGDYIIANNKDDAYVAINTYLKPGSYIKVNISKNPPKRSYLFQDKLPKSHNRFEIIMFLIALLALYNLNKSIKQFRHLSQKQLEDKKDKHLSQPNSINTLNH